MMHHPVTALHVDGGTLDLKTACQVAPISPDSAIAPRSHKLNRKGKTMSAYLMSISTSTT